MQPDGTAKGLFASLRRGVGWSYSSLTIQLAAQLVVAAVSARLLDPQAFGIFAMANAALHLASFVARMGLSQAVVQRAQIDEETTRLAYSLSVSISVAIAIFVWSVAPLVAGFFSDTSVSNALRLMVIATIVSGIESVPRALLQRRHHFRAIAGTDLISYLLGYAGVTLTLASIGIGVESLIAGTIAQRVVSATLSLYLAPQRLALRLDWTRAAGLLGVGAGFSVASFLDYVGTTLDSIVIGRFASSATLGLYNRAFILANLPTYNLTRKAMTILFPVLSRAQAEMTEFRKVSGALATIAMKILVPLAVGMYLAAHEIVTVAFGDRWLDAIEPFAILSFALAIGRLSVVPAVALEALGRLTLRVWSQGIHVVALAVMLVVAANQEPFDLMRVVYAIAAAHVARVLVLFAIALKVRAIDMSAATRTCLIGVFAGVGTWLSITGALAQFPAGDTSSVVRLGVAMVTGLLMVLILLLPYRRLLHMR